MVMTKALSAAHAKRRKRCGYSECRKFFIYERSSAEFCNDSCRWNAKYHRDRKRSALAKEAAAARAEQEAAAAAEMARNEWYTPPAVVEAARRVMGGIDLDPASSPQANEIVGAARFYTIKDDGLKQPWSGRVWLNPPYGRFAPKFVLKFAAVHPEEVPTACLLLAVHHMTTKWFAPLAEFEPVVCMPDHRLQFSGSTVRPAHGSVILGFAINEAAFRIEFNKLGRIWTLS